MFSVIAVTFNLKYLLFRISFTLEYLLSGTFFLKKSRTNLIFICSNSIGSVLW